MDHTGPKANALNIDVDTLCAIISRIKVTRNTYRRAKGRLETIGNIVKAIPRLEEGVGKLEKSFSSKVAEIRKIGNFDEPWIGRTMDRLARLRIENMGGEEPTETEPEVDPEAEAGSDPTGIRIPSGNQGSGSSHPKGH